MSRKERKQTPVTQKFSDAFKMLVGQEMGKGKNKKEIAAGIGISDSQLSDYETDGKTPTIDTLYKICKYFGVNADFMLGLSKEKNLDEDLRIAEKSTGLSKEAIESIHAIRDGTHFTRPARLNEMLQSKEIGIFLSSLDGVQQFCETLIPHNVNEYVQAVEHGIKNHFHDTSVSSEGWLDSDTVIGYRNMILEQQRQFHGALYALSKAADRLADSLYGTSKTEQYIEEQLEYINGIYKKLKAEGN